MPSPRRTCLQIAVCSLIGLIGAAPAANAQGFTVFTIAYATSANAATAFPIIWSGGNPGMTVNLFLMKKAPYSKIATIAANIPNSGSFNWTVPSAGGGIVCGHEYAISVTRLATPTTNTLGPWFKIECGGTGFTNFTVLYPGANNLVFTGSNFAIKWAGGNAGTPLNIFLMKKTPYSVVATVAMNVPNTGLHAWSVPNPGGPIPIFCGHEYAFSVTTLTVPTSNTLGPWFKILCGRHNLQVSKTRSGNGLIIRIRNGLFSQETLPVGAQVQFQTTLAPGLTVTSIFASAPWTCIPSTATGPASMTCSLITTAPVYGNATVAQISLLTSGSPSSQSCSTVKLFLKNNAGQYVVAPEATLDDNQACAQ